VALWALLGAMLVVFGAAAPSAAAHTALESSDPADGGTVDRPPASIQLVFAGRVSAPDPLLTVTVAGFAPVEAPAVIDGDTVTADLSAVDLPGVATASYPASWQVGYRLVASDGDAFSGDIAFTVTGPAAPAPATTEAAPVPATPTVATSSDPSTSEVSAAAPGTADSEQPASSSAGPVGPGAHESHPEVTAAAPGTTDGGVRTAAASSSAAAPTEGGGSGWWWAAVAVLALAVGVTFARLRKRRAAPPPA
jgi:methionine-rich copper-binding protein CopC